MFGHESLPSVVYSYDAAKPIRDSRIWDQLRAAHKFRNALVEIERRRRAENDAVLQKHYPRLAELESLIQQVGTELESLCAESRRANAEARRRLGKGKDEIKACRKKLAELRTERKELRAQAWGTVREPGDSRLKTAIAQVDGAAVSENKRAYAACEASWGTRLVVMKAMQGARRGAPPKFQRWNGNGRVAVQLQGGLPVGKLSEENDTRLRVHIDSVKPNGKAKATVRLRIGSEARDPIWFAVQVHLHRPLPDATIKEAWLLARRVGPHTHWSVQFVLSRAGWQKHDLALDGAVGVNLGWRMIGDGLRVAYWHGSDGETGELQIPAERLKRWKKCEDLQAIRDIHFNAILPPFAAWLKAAALPEWMVERTKSIALWRSAPRLGALVVHWRSNRFDGDTEMFDTMETWRKKDKHLWTWQAEQTAGNIRWRDDYYRKFAAKLRRKYRTIIVDDLNYRELQARPKAEDEGRGVIGLFRVASCGKLAALLRLNAGESIRANAKEMTLRCHACGERCDFNQSRDLIHCCEHCGETWDQDYNHAMNLAGEWMAAARGGVV